VFQLVSVDYTPPTGRTGLAGPQVWPHIGPVCANRFRELHRQIDGISERMLTVTRDQRGVRRHARWGESAWANPVLIGLTQGSALTTCPAC
jgi:hypothetical protein